jgi:hypothetical protein
MWWSVSIPSAHSNDPAPFIDAMLVGSLFGTLCVYTFTKKDKALKKLTYFSMDIIFVLSVQSGGIRH